MKVAIISDIHGNRHAFEAVLGEIAESQADTVWCLGDLVGYGGDPDACVALARRHAAVCLAGNHDLAVTGELSLDDFLARRESCGALDARRHRSREPRVSDDAGANRGGARHRPVSREPA